jgi:hypothetical protein
MWTMWIMVVGQSYIMLPSVELTKVCLEMGANVNARSIKGCTPNGFVGVIRVLLHAGANVDLTKTTDRHHSIVPLEMIATMLLNC